VREVKGRRGDGATRMRVWGLRSRRYLESRIGPSIDEEVKLLLRGGEGEDIEVVLKR